MIVFDKLRWKNFLSYGNYWTELSLAKSEMTLIHGDNGAGKSTFLDALTFCLFGKPFRNINLPQLPNSINGKDCLVECEFSIGNTNYLIRRGMSPKVFEIHKDGSLLDQDSKSKDYQKMLEEQILKMSYKAFCQVVILGSTNYIPFMRLPAGDRRLIVESLLDINIFSSMNVILKEKISANKENLRTLDTAIEILTSKTDTQRKYLDVLEDRSRSSLEQIEEELKENSDAESRLEGVLAKSSNILHEINVKKTAKAKILKNIDSLEKLLATINKKIAALDKEIASYEEGSATCPSCGQPLTEEHRETEIAAKNKKRDEMTAAVEDLNKRIAAETQSIEDKELVNVDAEFDKISEIVSNHRQKLGVVKKMIERLEGEKTKVEESQSSLDKERIALEDLQDNLHVQEEALNSAQKDMNLLSSAQTILKDNGIKTKIIKHYLPIMNKMINHYLTCLDFFVQFTLDENFNETIKSRHRDDFTYASFSEGEKMRIDLSLLLAWREIARLKNSTNCNLLVLDEVFDSSLDGGGTDEFMKLLRALGKKCNVFVISHKSDQLIDKFQDVISFSKKNNFSRINR
jgi:DNA repair exonuclease SbcCD ATPase subunit